MFETQVSEGGALLPIRTVPVQFRDGDFGPRYKGVPLKAVMIPERQLFPRLMATHRAAFVRIGGVALSPLARHLPVRMNWTTAATLAGLTFMREGRDG